MFILKTFLIPLQERGKGTVARSQGRNTGIREKGRRKARIQGKK
jgi:hypothetical protein